jgi:serine/threonine-protein kinase
MVLLPLLGLLTGAGIAVALVAALSNGHPASTANAAETHESGSIVLDAGAYIGRPVDEVAQRLANLGLDVEPRPEVRDDVVPDQVTGIDPAGKPLSAGDTVVVTYAVAKTGDGASSGGAGVTGAAVGDQSASPQQDVVTGGDQQAGATVTGAQPTPTSEGTTAPDPTVVTDPTETSTSESTTASESTATTAPATTTATTAP